MKINLTQILILTTVLLAAEIYGQDTISTPDETIITSGDLKNLIGEWTGTLTYLDYSSNKPYSMPANLIVKQGGNENQYLLSTNYPNEPKANSKGKITVSKNGKQLNKKDLKSKERLPDGQIQLITEYVGKDNNKKAFIRNIYILGEKQFIIRKEVRFENTNEWLKRNEYNYKRQY